MSESIFQNSGCVNTILGSMIHLSSFLPVICPIFQNTTLNRKYGVLPKIAPTTVPKLQYFGIGTNGFYCTASSGGSHASTHVKRNPDCRNMDLYRPLPILTLTEAEDRAMSWEAKSQYRMRTVSSINGSTYVQYYLKKIFWNPDRIQVVQVASNGAETEFPFSESWLTPELPNIAQTGSNELTSATRIIVRALGECEVTMEELQGTLNTLDQDYIEISEFGFYTGCDVFLDPQGDPMVDEYPENDNLIDGAASIEAAYVQLAKHKTQLPVTLQDVDSSVKTTVSFEAANSISI